MKKILKRGLTVAIAGVMSANCLTLANYLSVNAESTKYELESGTFSSPIVAKSDDSASGGSYVFFDDGSQDVTVTVNVETSGTYTVMVGYAAPYDTKTESLYVNGVDQGTFNCNSTAEGEWAEVQAGNVTLNAGENTIGIKCGWSWVNLDYITISETVRPDISASDTTCCDPAATAEADSLMKYLSGVYGNNIISGQQEIYKYGPHDFEYEFQYIYNTTGKYPAIRGFDFLNCANALNPDEEDGTADRIIQWVNDNPYADTNGIATASWHVVVPKDFSSYTLGDKVDYNNYTYKPGETDFEPSKILEEGSKEREYYMLCLEELAKQLQKLQDANVPLIFRPLHEAEGAGGETGSWFWWGKDGSTVYKDLWILTYETLTETYGLHNLIWEWNSYAFDTSENWYPGAEYVDIIGYDKYNCTVYDASGNASLVHNDSAIANTYYTIMEKYNSTKMVSIAENDSIPTVSNLQNDKAGWLYFCTWYDGGSDNINFISSSTFNTQDDLKEMYNSDYCITLDELPSDLYSNGTAGTGTKEPYVFTTTTTTAIPAGKGDAAKIVADSGSYKITFKEAMGESINLVFDVDDTVSYANGGVGMSIELNGTYYWVNIQWEYNGDNDIIVDLTKPLNVTIGTVPVTDESIIQQVVAIIPTMTSADVQIWSVNDSDKNTLDSSTIRLTGAYLTNGSIVTTSTEETTTEEISASDMEETTTTTAVETTAESETETSAEGSETTATTPLIVTETIAETSESDNGNTSSEATSSETPSAILYGDVNQDGRVDITDAVMLNKAVSGSVTLSGDAIANADCKHDGSITVDDATTLLQFLVSIIKSIPVE